MNYDTIEYSVCTDCYMELAYSDNEYDISAHIDRELNGRRGHFSTGIAIPEPEPEDEDDPFSQHCEEDEDDGSGYIEFTWHDCELCQSSLGGSRYGVTLFIELEE